MEKKNTPGCEPCEQMFEKRVETMVDDVEHYSKTDHDNRQKEVADAFKHTGHDREHPESHGRNENRRETEDNWSRSQGNDCSCGCGTEKKGSDWTDPHKEHHPYGHGTDGKTGSGDCHSKKE